MLRKCHNHEFDELTQIHIFWNGLQPQPKLLLDATTSGSLLSKSEEDVVSIIDRMALNDHHVQYKRGTMQRKPSILELGANDVILA